jgi:predicted metalloprotease with PDZ domain
MMPIRSGLACLLFAAPLLAQSAPQNAVRLRVDATDAPRRIFHVQMSMAAKPGPMTLLYPKWIPGEHGPTGPIENLVGLQIKSAGQSIRWRRDDVNLYAFHIDVPAVPGGGQATLDVTFDVISAPDTSGFSSASSTTTELAVLNWNQLILYPEGAPADTMQYQASLRVPNSWKYGTALPIDRESGNDVEFKPASLTTLIDSPLSAGRHYRTVGIGTDNGIPHYVHFAGDSEESVAAPDELIAHYRSLVNETGALFQSRHYRDYHFLVTLSDHVANFGLEHHESSDDRVKERTLIEASGRTAEASLLSHEFVHSWNGKYRRPDGLVSGGSDGGYDAPMKGELLWVYEGLTNYLGEILAARSGLWTPEEYRDALAGTAAEMDTRSGRAWRPLEDTAVFAQVLYDASDDYREYRRSTDYYPEGSLIWLDVDTLIRQLSKGAKSLDDFCRAFHGGPGGAPAMKTYTLADVVASLNAVQPYDWAGYFKQRLESTSAHAPLGGIARGGWKLAYTAERSGWWRADEEYHKRVDLTYSLGLKVKEEDGTIIDVAYDGSARKAGVTPSVKLIAVNGREFTPTVLREAVKASGQRPVELLIKNGEFYETHRLEYSGGERYPHLVRDGSAPDLLSQVIAAKAGR